MNSSTVALFGGFLAGLAFKKVYESMNDEPAPLAAIGLVGVAGFAATKHLATSQVGFMQALNNGKNGTGKVGPKALAVLEKVNPGQLYRDSVSSDVKIGLVYPNEKTVGAF